MKSGFSFKPGIVSGIYPERKIASTGLLDHWLAKWRNLVGCRCKYNQRRLRSVVKGIHCYADEFATFDDRGMQESITRVKSALATQGLIDDNLKQAFALVMEMADRTLHMRHYDVQLIGGWIMIKGMVAEMETGEGKTFVATLPACVAAMAGIPVHVVTVNDYLVKRDAELMGPLYRAFGLTVGIVVEGMDRPARKAAYACDITYCCNKQLTFDYLKDRMVLGRKGTGLHLLLDRLYAEQSAITTQLHLRGLCFAIVDEADSVLIDESRTPLILSREIAPLEQLHIYQQALDIADKLKEIRDFFIDHRHRHIELTESGARRVQQLAEPLKGVWIAPRRCRELVLQALSARHLFVKDVNYLVKDEKVFIIDEFTGRVMPDRTWEHGLHQLIETKEGCPISGQKETLCRISYQTFFRRYLHLAGMTGTAQEVGGELFSIYRKPVIKVPTHKVCLRKKLRSRHFSTSEQKWSAIVGRIAELHRAKRPILVGTRTVQASELLGRLLNAEGLPHRILNARQDADEAEIVKMAGGWGNITVATNMAGRGTDIKLDDGINEIGGLHVLATEGHEARRIDRQLFGRCARQGDAGSYEMFLSFEDEIVVNYAPRFPLALAKMMIGLTFPGSQRFADNIFRWAQIRAERHHHSIRAGLLKMDEHLQNLLAFSGKAE